jgi:hypothetical protein
VVKCETQREIAILGFWVCHIDEGSRLRRDQRDRLGKRRVITNLSCEQDKGNFGRVMTSKHKKILKLKVGVQMLNWGVSFSLPYIYNAYKMHLLCIS